MSSEDFQVTTRPEFHNYTIVDEFGIVSTDGDFDKDVLKKLVKQVQKEHPEANGIVSVAFRNSSMGGMSKASGYAVKLKPISKRRQFLRWMLG